MYDLFLIFRYIYNDVYGTKSLLQSNCINWFKIYSTSLSTSIRYGNLIYD